MEFLVIAYSFLAFILVVLLASPTGQRMDKKQRRIERINNSVGQPYIKSLSFRFMKDFWARVSKAFRKNSESSFLRRKMPTKQKRSKPYVSSCATQAYLWIRPISSL